VPGIEPITSSAILAGIGNGAAFSKGPRRYFDMSFRYGMAQIKGGRETQEDFCIIRSLEGIVAPSEEGVRQGSSVGPIVLALCDGMGGDAAGEVAARIVATTFIRAFDDLIEAVRFCCAHVTWRTAPSLAKLCRARDGQSLASHKAAAWKSEPRPLAVRRSVCHCGWLPIAMPTRVSASVPAACSTGLKRPRTAADRCCAEIR